MLTVERLTVAFGPHVAVQEVSFEVPDGEVLALLGASGSGKSTVLRAIAGLERPRSGAVRLDGADLAGVPVHRRGIALMFQDGQLFPHLSVAENVGYALRVRRTPAREATARVAELLDLVGLPGYGGRAPASLSGGEQQRVALARALAVRPRLLLLDEPLSALDRSLRERLATDLHDILAAEGTTALLVTHDHDEAFAVAGRMGLMRAGRLVQVGTAEEVWRRPVDAEAAQFLGYATVVGGRAAEVLLGAPPREGAVLALRRSALRVDPSGAVPGVVRSVRATAEVSRLTVEVAGAGLLHAVAGLDVPVLVGAPVRLRLDGSRTALVQGAADPEA